MISPFRSRSAVLCTFVSCLLPHTTTPYLAHILPLVCLSIPSYAMWTMMTDLTSLPVYLYLSLATLSLLSRVYCSGLRSPRRRETYACAACGLDDDVRAQKCSGRWTTCVGVACRFMVEI